MTITFSYNFFYLFKILTFSVGFFQLQFFGKSTRKRRKKIKTSPLKTLKTMSFHVYKKKGSSETKKEINDEEVFDDEERTILKSVKFPE
jgi:hypothetical protein